MAQEENKQGTTEAQPAKQEKPAHAAGASKLPIIITAAAAVVCMTGGFFVAKMFMGPKSARAETTAAAEETKAAPEKKTEKKSSEKKSEKKGKESSVTVNSSDSSWLFDLEPVVANLDEPGVTRYVRASIILEIDNALPDSKGTAILDENKAVLRNWLNLYLAGCTLDDIRGRKNLARIQAEIKDAFNDLLFKNSKPMITKVLFKEFQIQ